MRSNTWTRIGASVVAAGVLMLGMTYATSGPARAGSQQISCDATPFTDAQADPVPDVAAAGIVAEPDFAAATCTPTRKVRTHTPTSTPTELPSTATPVPSTAVPTNTPKAATDAVAVKPPNTGSGSGVSGDITLWLVALAAAAVVLGGAALLVGARRR